MWIRQLHQHAPIAPPTLGIINVCWAVRAHFSARKFSRGFAFGWLFSSFPPVLIVSDAICLYYSPYLLV